MRTMGYCGWFVMMTTVRGYYISRNSRQAKYMELLKQKEFPLLVVEGPAGTGKTAIACQHAMKLLQEKKIRKVIITRPTVPSDDGIGFLKGGLNEKMTPWLIPLLEVFEEFHDRREIQRMIEDNVLEMAPLSFMRGRTFKSCFVIADEMQNATPAQTKMLLTRIGENSKMVVTGDITQSDLKKNQCGLEDLIERLEMWLPRHEMYNKGIAMVRFEEEHIERSPIVSEISKMYNNNHILVLEEEKNNIISVDYK